jgi:hypothetical protein
MLTTLFTTLALALPLAVQDAPSESDPEAVKLLEAFAERVYDPVAAGLESLSFDVDMSLPMMGGSVGVLTVHWKKGAETTSDFELSDAMKERVPPSVRGEIASEMGEQGKGIAKAQVNQLIKNILGDNIVTLAGVQDDGLTEVVCSVRPGAEGDVGTLLFDDEGVLVKGASRSPGDSEVGIQTYDWIAMKAVHGKLVLRSSTEGMMGIPQRIENVLTHQDFGGFVFITRIVGSREGEPYGTMELSNFVVNGEAVTGEALETEG